MSKGSENGCNITVHRHKWLKWLLKDVIQKRSAQKITWSFVEVISNQARHKFRFAFSVKIDDEYFHQIFSWFITHFLNLWNYRKWRCSVGKGVLRNFRSSHPEVFLGKSVLKICSKFTGEHPCQSVILLKSYFSMGIFQ